MPTLTNQLFQVDDTLFLDLDALNLIRFEVVGLDASAYLRFKDGGTETVHGETARNLQQRMMGAGNSGENTPSPVKRTERSGALPEPAPSQPIKLTLSVNTTSLLGRNKAWFYRNDQEGRSLILAFVNAKGSCSVRPFDAETGIALGKRYASGPYQEEFADSIDGATELTVDHQPNLERDCKQRLPERLFGYLRKQIEGHAGRA